MSFSLYPPHPLQYAHHLVGRPTDNQPTPCRLAFEEEGLKAITERSTRLNNTIQGEESTISSLSSDKSALLAEIKVVEDQIAAMKVDLAALQGVLEEKNGEVEEAKRKVAKGAKVLDGLVKEVGTAVRGFLLILASLQTRSLVLRVSTGGTSVTAARVGAHL